MMLADTTKDWSDSIGQASAADHIAKNVIGNVSEIVAECLKDPANAIPRFQARMDQLRRKQHIEPGHGFIRITLNGEVVLLTAEEAGRFIEESESGPEHEKQIAAKVKRLLTCHPKDIYIEAVFIRMLVESTLDAYRAECEGEDTQETKELLGLISSVETRLIRRMLQLEKDMTTLVQTEKVISEHRKKYDMDAFEDLLAQMQEVSTQGDRITTQHLNGIIKEKRGSYVRATNVIQTDVRIAKIARRDNQIHISVLLRYLQALMQKKKDVLVSSLATLRAAVERESEGGIDFSQEISMKEKQLEVVTQQERLVNKQASDASAVVAAVTESEGLPPGSMDANVDDLVKKSESQSMVKKTTPKPKEQVEKKKQTGMHIRH